ncbi:PD-(D/E)XK nuclease family protein, partial [Nodosilinea sp. AN01ver1]|uniref:PD-(D/E)XK nuclease family protein n=1 Tax=Nodosilinea sp. AN01ver1 TaxID=3423362 RepID=UPI003D310F1D
SGWVWGTVAGDGGERCIEPKEKMNQPETLASSAFLENEMALSDYLLYQKCPRQYMLFRKYGFVASRSQTQMFGNIVHQTLEDLHHLLMSRRAQA